MKVVEVNYGHGKQVVVVVAGRVGSCEGDSHEQEELEMERLHSALITQLNLLLV